MVMNQNPFGGFMPMLRNNSDALLQAGVGLLSGRTPQEQFAMGAQGFTQGRKENKTKQWLMQNAPPEIAQAVEAGAIAPKDAFRALTEAKTKRAPLEINGKLVDPETYQVLADFSTKPGEEGATEYGLNPIYGTDANNNPVILQMSKAGTVGQAKLPEGVSLSKEPIRMDVGTGFVLMDPITRQQIGFVPKDLAGAAADQAGGKSLGEDRATLASMQSKMPGLEKTVSKLDELAQKATYTTAGRVLDRGMAEAGMEQRPEAVARAEYIATVDNQILPLLRDTFGAQFTQKEGETLRATLGDPNRSPQEKQAVLKAFIEQKRRDVEALAARTGAAPTASPKRRIYNPTTGMLE